MKDPWTARDDYIRVILDRSNESLASFFGVHATHPLDDGEQVRALKLLEMQRHAMLMYTSCGWFFDELSGLETVQVIHYAARALRLAPECNGRELEPGFDRASANRKEQSAGTWRRRAHLRKMGEACVRGQRTSGGPLRHQLVV